MTELAGLDSGSPEAGLQRASSASRSAGAQDLPAAAVHAQPHVHEHEHDRDAGAPCRAVPSAAVPAPPASPGRPPARTAPASARQRVLISDLAAELGIDVPTIPTNRRAASGLIDLLLGRIRRQQADRRAQAELAEPEAPGFEPEPEATEVPAT